MNHGRQLRLFLSNSTSSGPRFYEIMNRTIQALAISPSPDPSPGIPKALTPKPIP